MDVHGVVVAAPPKETAALGQGKAARSAGIEASRSRVTHRSGEAAVHVDRGQVVRPMRPGEALPHAHGRGRPARSARSQQVRSRGRSCAVQENPAVGGDAQPARRGATTQQHGCARLTFSAPRLEGGRVGDRGRLRVGFTSSRHCDSDRRGGVRWAAGPGERGETASQWRQRTPRGSAGPLAWRAIRAYWPDAGQPGAARCGTSCRPGQYRVLPGCRRRAR